MPIAKLLQWTVVTHRALVVAERDLDIVTVKTIQWKRSPLGGVPIAAQAVLRSSYHFIELHCAADIFVNDSLFAIRDRDDCTDANIRKNNSQQIDFVALRDVDNKDSLLIVTLCSIYKAHFKRRKLQRDVCS